jgi:hypothetical protein
MTVNAVQTGLLDYAPVRYGKSRLVFRGPKREIGDDYITVIGGNEVYGRFVSRPFADLVEDGLGMPVLNLGCQNAGLDAFLYDNTVLSLAKGARLNVVQVLGAQNLSNRFYRVHPRRNDRFLGPSERMRVLFDDVDFTDFSFVRHMLSKLHEASHRHFNEVLQELRAAWVARMKLMLQAIDGPVILLWLREPAQQALGAEPLFIVEDMIEAIAPGLCDLLEVPIERAGNDLDGMIFDQMEGEMAAQMLNVVTHRQIATELVEAIRIHL